MLWRKWEEFDPGRDFFSWACGVRHNEVRNLLRRATPGGCNSPKAAWPHLRYPAEGRQIPGNRSRFLARCLESSPTSSAAWSSCAISGDRPIKAIAEEMGISPAALTMRLQRIRKTVFECMEQAAKDETGDVAMTPPPKQFVVPPSGGENRLKPELQTELWRWWRRCATARLRPRTSPGSNRSCAATKRPGSSTPPTWTCTAGCCGGSARADGGGTPKAEWPVMIHLRTRAMPLLLPKSRRPPAVSPIIIRTSPALPSGAFSLSSPLGGWLLSYAVATVITGAAILGAWVYKVSQESGASVSSEQVVNTGHPLLTPGKTESGLVGQITGMSECRWAGPQDAPAAAVPLGRKYELAAGLVEISYQSGAKVILQGPCTYEVDSVAGGFLSRGKLTARVEHGSEFRGQGSEHYPLSTSHYPLFSVRTPTAVVTDLGTEFGVEVTREGNTDARVFQGARPSGGRRGQRQCEP